MRKTLWSSLPVLGAAVLVLATGAVQAEPLPPLNLQLRVLDIAGQPGGAATARIQVTALATVDVASIALEIRTADGRPWPLPVAGVTSPVWSASPGGKAERGELWIPRNGWASTILEVPLPGRAVHEIVLGARAETSVGPVTTEGLAVAEWGAHRPAPVDDGTVAEFPAVPSKEGR